MLLFPEGTNLKLIAKINAKEHTYVPVFVVVVVVLMFYFCGGFMNLGLIFKS